MGEYVHQLHVAQVVATSPNLSCVRYLTKQQYLERKGTVVCSVFDEEV